jgi:hypothetical protein
VVNALVISDLQIPFEHKDALRFCKEIARKHKCTEFYCVGDELDLHAFSRFVSDPDLYSPGHEMQEAKDRIREWYKAFPTLRLCNSNHVDRLKNKFRAAGIPAVCQRPIGEILETPRWIWQDSWAVDDVRVEHGHELFGKFSVPKTALSRAVEKNWCSTVFGHTHSVFGVQYVRNVAGRFFGMGVGCLIDEHAAAFDYAGSKKDIQLGCGVLLNGRPHLEAM